MTSHTPNKRGRPSRAQSLSRDQVLDCALLLLQRVGSQAFSIRALARELGITPMSVLYHVTDLQTLLQLLVERVHGAPISLAHAHSPQKRVMLLLGSYMQRVREHPALMLCVFSSPALFTHALATLTQQLEHEVAHCDAHPALLRDLLVDYTHGYALSLALAPTPSDTDASHFYAAVERIFATSSPL